LLHANMVALLQLTALCPITAHNVPISTTYTICKASFCFNRVSQWLRSESVAVVWGRSKSELSTSRAKTGYSEQVNEGSGKTVISRIVQSTNPTTERSVLCTAAPAEASCWGRKS
jgi:hypothetical protein